MKNQIAQTQIDEVTSFEIDELLEKLPANGHAESKFTEVGPGWAFNFTFASPLAHFAAHGTGSTPREAFLVTKAALLGQIADWRKMREGEDEYFPRHLADGKTRRPKVLIVDDDVDTARSTEMIFRRLGCDTETVTDPHMMSRKISFEEADFIILDWKLEKNLEGGDILLRANRLIDSFADLRSRFGYKQTKVITHSVLPGAEIQMPSSRYFQHMDHWQKPLRFDQLVQRGGAVLNACGF